MPSFVPSEVVEVLSERPGLQKVVVRREDEGEGDRAYVLTKLIGSVSVGDRVVLNTTAVDLGLGTGGWHFVHWNLARDEFKQRGDGNSMKLRYTSLQFDTATAEEADTFEAPATLDGLPVVCAQLLSQVAPIVVAYKHIKPAARVALLMSDQNALPLAMSDLVAQLVDEKLIDITITAGQSFGGDHEVVTVLSGLGLAASEEQADVVVVTEGPGSLGTGSRFGFSTLELASVLDDVAWYNGKPILALRWSDADERIRHKELSHHSRTVLERAGAAAVAIPRAESFPEGLDNEMTKVDVPDVKALMAGRRLEVTTMGRNVRQDPRFFEYAAAAGVLAAQLGK